MNINEQTSAYCTVRFYNRAGDLAIPISAQYRVDCSTTLTSLVPPTPLTPASVIEIHITASQNRIIDPANAQEEKSVTVVANYGTDDMITTQTNYTILNLHHVP